MTREQATTAITGAGFAVGVIVSAYSSTVPAGQVIDQVPGAGTSAPAGTRVAFTVSIGAQPAASPTPAAVPNVVGQPQATAVSTLQSAGFTAIVQQVTGVSGATGTVTAQSPSAGVLAVPGSSVTILVPLAVDAHPDAERTVGARAGGAAGWSRPPRPRDAAVGVTAPMDFGAPGAACAGDAYPAFGSRRCRRRPRNGMISSSVVSTR